MISNHRTLLNVMIVFLYFQAIPAHNRSENLIPRNLLPSSISSKTLQLLTPLNSFTQRLHLQFVGFDQREDRDEWVTQTLPEVSPATTNNPGSYNEGYWAPVDVLVVYKATQKRFHFVALMANNPQHCLDAETKADFQQKMIETAQTVYLDYLHRQDGTRYTNHPSSLTTWDT